MIVDKWPQHLRILESLGTPMEVETNEAGENLARLRSITAGKKADHVHYCHLHLVCGAGLMCNLLMLCVRFGLMLLILHDG